MTLVNVHIMGRISNPMARKCPENTLKVNNLETCMLESVCLYGHMIQVETLMWLAWGLAKGPMSWPKVDWLPNDTEYSCSDFVAWKILYTSYILWSIIYERPYHLQNIAPAGHSGSQKELQCSNVFIHTMLYLVNWYIIYRCVCYC